MNEKSRQIGIRIGGELRKWLEAKTEENQTSITELVHDALNRAYIYDHISEEIQHCTEEYREIEDLIYSDEGMELFRQQFDISAGPSAFPSQWADYKWAIHRPTDTMFIFLKYIGEVDTREQRLQLESDRLFTQWLGKARIGEGERFIDQIVHGRKYLLVDVRKAKFLDDSEEEYYATILARLHMKEKSHGKS